jgi:predicted PurR-regulated permease PerM
MMLGIDHRAAAYTWSAALVLLFLLGVYKVRGTLFVFALALLLAYLLYPLIDFVDRFVPSRTRTPALGIVYVLLLAVLVFAGVEIGSKVVEQANSLAQSAPKAISQIEQPVHVPNPSSPLSMKEWILNTIRTQVQQHSADLARLLPKVGLQVLSYSTNLIVVVIVPILSFFILKDGRNMRDEFLVVFERVRQRELMENIFNDIHLLLLQYLRALLILCCATFAAFSIVFSFMGLPYALLLASIAFPLEFIPVLGPLVAAIIIIAVASFSGFPYVLWVVVFLACFRIFQDYVLSPNVMGAGIELHPMLIIFGVLAGGEIGGIGGTFLSVPVLAVMRIVYIRTRENRLKWNPIHRVNQQKPPASQ